MIVIKFWNNILEIKKIFKNKKKRRRNYFQVIIMNFFKILTEDK